MASLLLWYLVYCGWRVPWRGGSTNQRGCLSCEGWGDDKHSQICGTYNRFLIEKWCQNMHSFLGLYHAGGRMILSLELSSDGVANGLRAFHAKKTTSSESIFFIKYYWKSWALKNKMREGIPAGAEKIFFQECECVALPMFVMECWS